MPNPIIKTVARTGRGGMFGIFKYLFKFKFAIFFGIILILNSFIIGIQANDASLALEDLGKRFLSPTVKLQEKSEIILTNGYFFSPEVPWYTEILKLSDIITQVWIIYILISVLATLLGASPFSNRIYVFQNNCLAIFLFLIIQMLYLSYLGKEIWQPITSIFVFIKIIPILLEPLVSIATKFTS